MYYNLPVASTAFFHGPTDRGVERNDNRDYHLLPGLSAKLWVRISYSRALHVCS